MARVQRMTVYDRLEAQGHFETNPANPGAKDSNGNLVYKGPVAYPQMFYHPTGEFKITKAAEVIDTPRGPKEVGEERELISKEAANEAEAKALRAEGWHDHPSDAIAAGGGVAPAKSGATVFKQKDDQIARLEEKLAQMQAELDAKENKKVLVGQSAVTTSDPQGILSGKPTVK